MVPVLDWLISRAAEPSTWAGLSALVMTLTWLPHATDIAQQIPAVGAGIAAIVAIVKAESGSK